MSRGGAVGARHAVTAYLLAGGAAVLSALILEWPTLSPLQPLLVLGLVGAVLLIVPTEIFLAGCLLFTGAMQAADDLVLTVGPATLYASDGLLVIVAIRAAWPKPRRSPYRFGIGLRLVLALVGIIALIGVIRAYAAGIPLVSALRAAQGFGYWIVLVWGFGRLFREQRLRRELVFKLSVLVALGLVVYLYLMTAMDRPFEAPGQSALGQVATSSGAILRRDYGFYSAFIFYPALALLGMSVMLYARRNIFLWGMIALLGVSATLTTLIRGQILGLVGGFFALIVISRREQSSTRDVGRARKTRLVILVSALVSIGAIALASTNSGYALALAERAIPLLEQSEAADSTAALRERALATAFDFSSSHYFGIGFISLEGLIERGIDPELIEHSLPTAALYYLGWPGLIGIFSLVIAFIFESRRAPMIVPWLHPFFVSMIVMMTLYGFGASGLFRQPFVIGLGAYVLAARFALGTGR